jgi:hypothetical protein
MLLLSTALRVRSAPSSAAACARTLHVRAVVRSAGAALNAAVQAAQQVRTSRTASVQRQRANGRANQPLHLLVSFAPLVVGLKRVVYAIAVKMSLPPHTAHH